MAGTGVERIGRERIGTDRNGGEWTGMEGKGEERYGFFNGKEKLGEKMIKAKVKIVGIKPLLFHKFNIESLTALTKAKSGSSGNDPEEWKRSFFEKGGKLYIPGSYIFASLKNGAVNTKVGRGTIQKTWISAVTVDEEQIFFNRKVWDGWENMELEEVPSDASQPVYLDIRMVSNPNTKGKNVRYRLAMSPGWEAEFNLTIDDSLISQSHAKKVIEDTGKLQGLADARTLGYGRFQVESLEFVKE